MKLLTFAKDGREALAVLKEDGQSIVPLHENGFCYQDMNQLIEQASQEELSRMSSLSKGGIGEVALGSVKLMAPIPHPRQDMICLGINYMAHAEESARYKKEAFGGDHTYPVYFSKRVGRASADQEPIPAYADLISTLDYEAELAVVIGKAAKNVSKEDAYAYVFGYTIINDVTARELQTRHKQWYFGKSLDGFTPMGPVILTADEVAVPPVFQVRSFVNGEKRQDSSTSLLIHDIAYVISELSQGMTLLPGTMIATGTPAGVGMGFDPPKFLHAGDEVVCEIEGIGRITNRVE